MARTPCVFCAVTSDHGCAINERGKSLEIGLNARAATESEPAMVSAIAAAAALAA
jgi:hypothetical protein